MDVVAEGNWAKFRADAELKGRLLGTGEMELVEASEKDRVWGIGSEEGGAEGRRGEWGRNLLGGVLMGVRERLRGEEGGGEGRGREDGDGSVGDGA